MAAIEAVLSTGSRIDHAVQTAATTPQAAVKAQTQTDKVRARADKAQATLNALAGNAAITQPASAATTLAPTTATPTAPRVT